MSKADIIIRKESNEKEKKVKVINVEPETLELLKKNVIKGYAYYMFIDDALKYFIKNSGHFAIKKEGEK